MPKLDPDTIAPEPAGELPAGFEERGRGRQVRVIPGLEDFVATHVVVPPGGWTAQRHWHEGEDEIAVVLSGDGVLIDEAGRHPMHAGDVAVFAKGEGNAHHIANEGAAPLVVLALSRPEATPVHYPDLGLRYLPGRGWSAMKSE